MSMRRRFLPVLAAALVLAGCSGGGPGDGADNDAGGGGSAITVTRDPSAQDSVICQLYDDSDLEAVFPVDVTVSGDDLLASEPHLGCVFTPNGFETRDIQIEINYDERRSATAASRDGSREIEFVGHPALASDAVISVSVGDDPDAPGRVVGFTGRAPDLADPPYDVDTGFTIMSALLERAVTEFAN